MNDRSEHSSNKAVAMSPYTTLHTTITAAVLDRLVAFLTPLFLDATQTNVSAARLAARQTLLSYGAATDREIRLVALIIAFGFGALDALSRAADGALAVNVVLRLRGNANALNRAAQQNERLLEKLQKARALLDAATVAAEEAMPDDLPASLENVDLLAYARTANAPMRSTAEPISRQQRRAETRQLEKTQRRQQEQDRLAQRAATRMAAAIAA
jgi:hypothetical protein